MIFLPMDRLLLALRESLRAARKSPITALDRKSPAEAQTGAFFGSSQSVLELCFLGVRMAADQSCEGTTLL
jgi:hypothetical protein